MTYREAAEVLAAAGIMVRLRSFGFEGSVPEPAGALVFHVGRASAGGTEMSVRREPAPAVRWFQRATLEELARLLIEARRLVERGLHESWLDALLALDPR